MTNAPSERLRAFDVLASALAHCDRQDFASAWEAMAEAQRAARAFGSDDATFNALYEAASVYLMHIRVYREDELESAPELSLAPSDN